MKKNTSYRRSRTKWRKRRGRNEWDGIARYKTRAIHYRIVKEPSGPHFIYREGELLDEYYSLDLAKWTAEEDAERRLREKNPAPTVEVLKQRVDSRDPDIIWYDLAVWVGKKRYWVDAVIRKSTGSVSVFKMIQEGGARQTSHRSKRGNEIQSAVKDYLKESARKVNPAPATDLIRRLKF